MTGEHHSQQERRGLGCHSLKEGLGTSFESLHFLSNFDQLPPSFPVNVTYEKNGKTELVLKVTENSSRANSGSKSELKKNKRDKMFIHYIIFLH